MPPPHTQQVHADADTNYCSASIRAARANHQQKVTQMIWTLTIKLETGRYATLPWEAEVEIDETSSLVDLHNMMQRILKFDNDHLYYYYYCRSYYAYKRQYLGEHARDYGVWHPEIAPDRDLDLPLRDLQLRDVLPAPAKYAMFYLFDSGDKWIFRIMKARKAPQKPVAGKKYPRVVAQSGEKQRQYGRDS